MINSVKARTPILALVLFVFSIGFTVAATNKVVVIPMAGDSTDPTIIQDLTDRIAVLESTQPLAYGFVAGGGSPDILSGYGFTSVSSPELGEYVLTLDKTIAGYAAVVATPLVNSHDTEVISFEANYNANIITIRIVNESNAAINTDFSIIVHGAAQ